MGPARYDHDHRFNIIFFEAIPIWMAAKKNQHIFNFCRCPKHRGEGSRQFFGMSKYEHFLTDSDNILAGPGKRLLFYTTKVSAKINLPGGETRKPSNN